MFLVENPTPLRHFLLLFLSTFHPLVPEWRTCWMASYFCDIITFFPTKVIFFGSTRRFTYQKIALQNVFGQSPVKYQRWSSFYVHLQIFLLVYQKAIHSSYSAKNLSVELAISIKRIWKNHVLSALRVHRKFPKPGTVWIS